MIEAMWFVVAVIISNNGSMVSTMSPSWPTQEVCEQVRTNGDRIVKSQGFKVESKCIFLGGTES